MGQTEREGDNARVLIVEENPNQLHTVVEMVEAEGFPVIGCGTAEEALTLMKRERFAILVLDIHLPSPDGAQFFQHVRKCNSATRIIIQTSSGSFASAKDAVNQGAFAYIEKTDGPAELIYHLHRAKAEYLHLDTQELRASEARFRTTFEQAAVGMAHIGLDGRFCLVNHKLCEILGRAREDLLQRWCQELTYPDDREKMEQQVQRILAGEIDSFSLEKRYLHKNGAAVWVTLTSALVRDTDQTPLYFVEVLEDISARKQIEEVQQRLVTILENTSDFVATTTVDGRGVYLNSAGRSLIGLHSDADLSTWTPSTVYTQQSGELMYKQIVPTELSNGYWKGEAVVVNSAGKEIPVSQVVVAHKEENGQVQYVSVIARDISEQKKAAEVLQTLSRRILEVQEQERRHLARELHDGLGQVLSALKLTLQNGQRQSVSIAERVAESVAMVEQALTQIRAISRNLRPPMLDDLGLEASVRWYMKQQEQLNGIRAKLVVDIPDQRFPSEVETTCFRVIQESFTNIMRHAQAQQVWVEVCYRDDALHVLVQDDGVGFDVEAAYADIANGTSIGLLGMRERAQLVGGHVRVTSLGGIGTEVRGVFPVTLDGERDVRKN